MTGFPAIAAIAGALLVPLAGGTLTERGLPGVRQDDRGTGSGLSAPSTATAHRRIEALPSARSVSVRLSSAHPPRVIYPSDCVQVGSWNRAMRALGEPDRYAEDGCSEYGAGAS